MESMRLSFRKGDWIAAALVIVLICVSAVCFWSVDGTESPIIQIYQNNTLVKECSLDKEETFVIEGAYENTIVIQGGKVAITKSDCPGEDCVHSGWISSMGRSIVCLPNRVEIRITGESEVDFVVR